MFWMNQYFDEAVRLWIIMYYTPYYIAGNVDNWLNLGVTLNGVKSSNICNPQR